MTNIDKRIIGFNKIFDSNIDLFELFKTRTLNTIIEVVSTYLASYGTKNLKEYLTLIGESHDIAYSYNRASIPETRLLQSKIYNEILLPESNPNKHILHIQALFWSKIINDKKKELLFTKIQLNIKDTGYPVCLIKTNNQYVFYPKGAKLLDEGLINESLIWLENYPIVYKHFNAALEKYTRNIYERNLIDDLRFSIEQLLRKLLNNSDRLEKQLPYIGKILKEKQISPQVRNMFQKLLDYYANYQNENVKHDENINKQEIEFIFYQTGVFIRFLISVIK